MSKPRLRMSLMSLLVVALAAPLAMAGSEKAATEKVEAQAEGLPPGMTAEDMAKWQQATSPGPEHARLAGMAGSYSFEGTFWRAPGAPPMTTTGTAERKMIMDGRVLVEKVKTEWQGEAFEGLSMTGYDNVARAYWGSWVDNMSTGMMTSAGTCSEGSCEFTGTFHDPMTGEAKTVRMTMTHTDGKEIHASYEPGPDGKEFKSMELVYTRAE